MARILFELNEAVRIAFEQIRAHKMRSLLTALGVIIGIVAVTLMGTAISGIKTSFESSLAMLGNDIIYVDKWPWIVTDNWWDYVNRPLIHPDHDARELNRVIQATPDSELEFAVPVSLRGITVQNGRNSASSVRAVGSTADYGRLLNVDFDAGRFFTETESDSGSAVAILGNDLAKLLFPGKPALGGTILVRGHPFLVIGVLAHQGAFLGLFSFDNQILLPLTAFHKYVSNQDWNGELQVKIKDQNRRPEAAEELIGAMRRVRAQLPGERDNFSVNQQDVFKEQLDPARRAIGIAGLIVTGLALFVGAIGIMNITFVSVMERTREIGTRKALGARRRTILTQFLVESASVALVGGFVGVGATWLLVIVLRHAMPSLPLQVSPLLILIGLGLSTATGILAGFVPAVGASRLDPVDALRYE